ncbi:uncharacterized protein C6orf136 homolog [Daktulosphaira vitifoliae]|uniref:uncharacterized protein C6orf136 homolog n=1 Tax=Daktulosphaira vitifoliae TaxID=58002 RepID=UPI0021A9D166|nr:uncharacterized protein C6orf136 homolog [Daktulosphaira vitifoliae]
MANAVRKICTKFGNGHQYLMTSNKVSTYSFLMSDKAVPLSISQNVTNISYLISLSASNRKIENKCSFDAKSMKWFKECNLTKKSELPIDKLTNRINKFSSSSSIPTNNTKDLPSAEQLQSMQNRLVEDLPKLFKENLDFSFYHPSLVFENNIRGTRSVGLQYFMTTVSLLRVIGHCKYAFVKFDVLKATKHPEDGTIKIRWRIKGISGFKVFVKFWKFKFWDLENVIKDNIEVWHDGFSIFYLGSDGLVHKLTADKMQPDNTTVIEPKNPLATKLALFLGLTQQANNFNLISLDVIEHAELLNMIIMSLEDAF